MEKGTVEADLRKALIETCPAGSAIVYVLAKKEAEALAALIQRRLGVGAACYHAGMSEMARRTVYDDWSWCVPYRSLCWCWGVCCARRSSTRPRLIPLTSHNTQHATHGSDKVRVVVATVVRALHLFFGLPSPRLMRLARHQ